MRVDGEIAIDPHYMEDILAAKSYHWLLAMEAEGHQLDILWNCRWYGSPKEWATDDFGAEAVSRSLPDFTPSQLAAFVKRE